MDGFRLLETIALELDVPVISEPLSPQPCSLSQDTSGESLLLLGVLNIATAMNKSSSGLQQFEIQAMKTFQEGNVSSLRKGLG